MPDPVPPVLEIPLRPDSAGSLTFPIVSFDSGSNTLFAASWRTDDSAYHWWRAHEPDFASAAALLLLLVTFWFVRRTLGRPRQAGRLYCRQCNYDLTPPDLSAGAEAAEGQTLQQRCPECGTSPGAHPPIRGRSTRSRLALPLLLLLSLLSATLWWTSCGVTTGSGSGAWPFDICARVVRGWPLARVQYDIPRIPVVTAWRLLPSVGRAGFEFRAGSLYPGAPTADGSAYVWVEFSDASAWNIELVTLDIASQTRRTVFLGKNSDGFGLLHGFTPDQRSAVVTITGLASGDNDGVLPVRVLCVDLADGTIRQVGATTVVATPTGTNAWQTPRIHAAVAPGENPSWAVLTADGPALGALALGEKDAVRTVSLSLTAVPNNAVLAFDAEGSLVMDGAIRIAPDGTTTKISSVPGAWKADFTASPPALLRDSTPVATLDLGPTRYAMNGTVFSPDGRWCAVVLANLGPGAPNSGVIKVWDLSQIPR